MKPGRKERRKREERTEKKRRATPSHPKKFGPPVLGVSCQDPGGKHNRQPVGRVAIVQVCMPNVPEKNFCAPPTQPWHSRHSKADDTTKEEVADRKNSSRLLKAAL